MCSKQRGVTLSESTKWVAFLGNSQGRQSSNQFIPQTSTGSKHTQGGSGHPKQITEFSFRSDTGSNKKHYVMCRGQEGKSEGRKHRRKGAAQTAVSLFKRQASRHISVVSHPCRLTETITVHWIISAVVQFDKQHDKQHKQLFLVNLLKFCELLRSLVFSLAGLVVLILNIKLCLQEKTHLMGSMSNSFPYECTEMVNR